MSDARPVHFIAHLTIDDTERYRVYERGFFPILRQHGAASSPTTTPRWSWRVSTWQDVPS